ncbi:MULTISPECIES: V-type ATP synthase subunit F [Aminobacterium]|jgi:vacuolar-type H+-ATPase subunit F/Vma7|uniref:Uncharacterized protein n=1 Tax=Aminobacterium colombiense (strain DSM 12261 / ALA-1) TaxID=572547 RepID=D5EEY0_AMICL|nr:MULTISPECIES: V-type ATP synthase subunit F [Aminobacterium]MDD2378313.1 V-type ATP synthase subunit F [Aminobacterium colombiense]ADE57112.1 hypothetical protein Amico_0987 [Aminobacterium colombiense DSM 12261]MDD3767268.1 V-type ATP synthase subunit F [Aminobacterium colombiense]MDD4265743.1 V-type ATP synthase subunit F [Aminobacterium colombiense]MDD4585101.1 V-type ATP synthase subunit F [Aminobacterium colombiense]
MTFQEKRALVLGRQLFIDLWGLEGFEGVLCEKPSDIQHIFRELLDESIAFVLVEESWFRNLPDTYRKRLAKTQKPVWIPFPSLEIETD